MILLKITFLERHVWSVVHWYYVCKGVGTCCWQWVIIEKDIIFYSFGLIIIDKCEIYRYIY